MTTSPQQQARTARLDRRIATYALAAGATLAGAAADVADAEVICRDIDDEIEVLADEGVDAIPVDIDGDGIVDFAILIDVEDDGKGNATTQAKAKGAPVGDGPKKDSQKNEVKLRSPQDGDNGPKAKPFSEGDVVTDGGYATSAGLRDFECSSGSPDRFIGVRLFRPIPGEENAFFEHFGFIGVCFEPAASTTTPARLVVRQVGFESVTSTPALIACELPSDGQIRGSGCQIGSERGLIDLAPLGMLALGAAGLGALRRRRRQVG